MLNAIIKLPRENWLFKFSSEILPPQGKVIFFTEKELNKIRFVS